MKPSPCSPRNSAVAAFAATLLLASVGSAQTTAPAEETVELSRFEVRAKTDKSYNISSATAGLKTRQDLIDIPGAIQIVPIGQSKPVTAQQTQVDAG